LTVTNLKSAIENAGNKGVFFINSSENTEYISYPELLKEAYYLLSLLRSRGVKPGSELIFQLDDNRKFLTTFWACIIGNIKAVPINPANTPETRKKLINVWNSLEKPYVISTAKIFQNLLSKLDSDELKHYNENRFINFELNFDNDVTQIETNEINENDIAFIQFSSGSTGNPKGVTLTHKNLLTNIEAIIYNSNLTPNDSTLGWMPLTHDLGLIGFHLVPILAGINQYLIPTEVFVRRPTLWIEKINEHRVSFTASPNFGYKHFLSFFKPEIQPNWDLSCVKRILNGAEPISATLCNEFLTELAPYGLQKTTMFPVYGMAEASLAVAFPEPDSLFESITISRYKLFIGDEIELNSDGIKFVCVGKAVKHCSFRINNNENIPLGEGKIGNIEIKGENVTKGYYNNSEANKSTFTSDGWLRTGDLGFVLNNKLYITGRAKDIIFSNGLNIYPHDLERIIEEEAAIETGKVVICGVPNTDKQRDEIVAFVYFKGKTVDFVPFIQLIKSKVSKRVSLDIDYVLPVKSIEKTTSGKVKRFFYSDNFLKGNFNDIIQEIDAILSENKKNKQILAPENELEQKLYELWLEILQHKTISTIDNFFEIGGNSLRANMLIGRIAKEFNAEISIREVFKFSTIKEMAKLLSDKKEHHFTAIPRISKRKHYPCSSAQKRLFILNQLEPNSLNYNISAVYKIKGKPELVKINKAFSNIIEKHTILRTYFELLEGEPVQKIADFSSFKVEEIKYENSVEYIAKQFFKPFNLFKPYLFRIGITCVDSNTCYLLFDIHHIISDGYSLNLIVKEFSELYNNPSIELINSVLDYSDFSVWQDDYLQSDRIKAMEAFWLKEFEEEDIPVLNFPTDYQRNKNTQAENGDFIVFELDKSFHDRLYNLAEKEASTYYILFLTTLNILLQKYTSQEDIVVGSPVTSRPHADLEHVFGPFINSVAIRNKPSADKTIKQFHHEVKEKALSVFSNQDYPFEQLVDKLQIERDLNRNALFDILFVLQNANKEKIVLDGLEVAAEEYFNGAIKFDLNVHAWEIDDSFKFKIEYATHLFKRHRIEQFALHFKSTLNFILTNFEATIADLELLTDSEKKNVLVEFNKNEKDFELDTALDLFKSQIQENASKIAVVDSEVSLNYTELDEITNFYANQLLELGVNKGDYVGINLESSAKVAIAMLAIWKAGAVYVPIDPENPSERTDYIRKDSSFQIIFADSAISECKTIAIQYKNKLSEFQIVNVSASDGAYVIYTSGTTGQPKGTLISHGSIANYVQSIATKHQISSTDSSVLLTSYAFDLGYTSLFGTLLNGGSIHFIASEKRKEPDYIIDYLFKNNISFIKSTPSQLFTLTTATNFEFLAKSNLNKIFTGGEAIKTDDVKKYIKIKHGLIFINHYGPTESTIGCITHELSDLSEFEKTPVIGSPIHNTSIYILNKQLKPVPIGVDGEIFISGKGLALDYLNKADLFAEKFISNPFVKNAKIYATGDIGRWTNSGTVQFFGRKDDQVKIRGYRVELKGIEAHLKSLDAIKDAVVIVKNDSENNPILCAYVVADEFNGSELRKKLANFLPEYMIPTFFIPINEIPITANGKLDKKKLPEPVLETNKERILPTSEIQMKLAEIWKEVLGIKFEIGINDNFFEIGGHSLKATICTAKIHQKLNVSVSLREFFENPEIQKLEILISGKKTNPYAAIPLAPQMDSYPASAAQKRMFILHQIEGDSTSYNMPGAFWVHGKLDKSRLNLTFEQLIKKHESLRTSFVMLDEELKQIIHHSFEFEIADLAPESSTDSLISNFIKPFNLQQAPLFRVGLASYSAEKHLLLFDIHHIISDGSSMGIIIKDFVKIYDEGYSEKLKIQYKDFAVWQNEFFKSDFIQNQKKYWLNQLEGTIPLTELPTDFDRPKKQTFQGESFTFKFDKELTSKLKAVCKKEDITLFMLLMGIYQLFLAKQTGQEEFTVGTPVAGRPHADLQEIIGVFLNTLVIKTQPQAVKLVKDYLKEVKQIALEAFENQDYPFHELVENLEVERIQNRNPLFDTMLVVQNMNIGELKTKDLSFEQYEFDLGSTQVDISWIVFENDETLDFTVNYNTALFKRKTIERFIERLTQTAESTIENLNRKINAIDSIPEAEKQLLLNDFNNTNFEYNRTQSIIDLLNQQALITPEKIAVIDDKRSLTYQTLCEKTNQLAHLLMKEGVKAGTIVPLVLERTSDTIISIIGVLKTGATYVFIDPAYPNERKAFMLEDCNAEFIITEKSCLDKISFDGRKIIIDDIDLTDVNTEIPSVSIDLNSTAYLIFTSGSTGKPKGVMISHRNMMAFIVWAKEEFKTTDAEIVYNATSYSFDLSIFEIFYSLTSGKTVRVIKDGLHIANYLSSDRKILINTVPVVVKNLLETNADLSHVVAINMAGEPIPQLVKNKLDFKKIEVRNLYGPSEDTTYSTIFKFEQENFIQNIGKPLSNTKIYILNKDMNLLPIGTPGELCISGEHLSKGYLNRPEITSERFVTNPFDSNSRLYKTGDLARWLENGEIEYLGRIDNQVKIRGFRIELEEIEKTLFKKEEIKDVVVVDLVNENTGDKFLCAYYVAEYEIKNLASYLASFLPVYMIPAHFVRIEKLPVSPNGKIDKKALPYPDLVENEEELVLPQSEIEEIILASWQQVLGIKSIGIHTNFFSVGGDSIKAIQVASKLLQSGLKLEVRQLFDFPTIKELAPHIVRKNTSASQEEFTGEFVLSPIQQLFFEKNFANTNHWNQSLMLDCRQKMNVQQLEVGFKKLIQHHDLLRTSFMEGKAYVKSFSESEFNIEVVETYDFEEIKTKTNQVQASLNIQNGELIKVCLFRCNGNEHLHIVIHHLVIDGISWRILIEDLQTVLNGGKLPLKTNNFNDWSKAIAEYTSNQSFLEKEKTYWQQQNDAINVLEFDAENKMSHAEKVIVSLGTELTLALTSEANMAYNTEINDLLLTALNRTFQNFRQNEKMSLMLEGHGREAIIPDLDINRTVGWFTSMYPVNLSFVNDLREHIIATKDYLHKIPQKGIGYGLLKYYQIQEYTSFPSVSFNYLGDLNANGSNELFTFSTLDTGKNIANENDRLFLLDFNLMIKNGILTIELTYNKLHLSLEKAQELAQLYKNNLEEIIKHCLGKEQTEITVSDMSFEISSDDFDNIF
jgi:amino acid adenylation domain-containing protein/non-ribosomal peptide synthase protein (TIGR01720 family)